MPSVRNPGSTVLLATAAVGTVSVLALLAVWWKRQRSGRSTAQGPKGPLTFVAATDPHRAVQEALFRIRGGEVATVGELVAFLRGPAGKTPDDEKLPNAYRSRVAREVIHYVQESYIPGTCSDRRAERCLFTELVAADHNLHVLEVQRAMAFDNDNRAHINLLQQLWVAAGKSLNTYERTGPHWAELGFQGDDPTTDLRGGGVLALRMLVNFAQRHPTSVKEMVQYNHEVQAAQGDSWYLPAVVSIQFSAQLMLQRDHPFFKSHLEVLYDTVRAGTAVSGTSSGRVMTRRQVAITQYHQVDLSDLESPNTLALWHEGPAGDAEAGLFLLHEALLLHFKECWERDQPHVMSYNTYVAEHVMATFFSEKWTLPAELLK